ncbi:MAG TPA: tripartite tricarboxylate transporter TctB family protein [Dongiaceae bacterium]|nr:tripartite tricarboxylate transporter TctB family protein [Dongiaceae bacterium]
MSRDFIAGCVLLVFSAIYYLAAAAIPASQLSDTVGPGGMPKSYGIALGVLSILLIGQSLLARRRAMTARATAASTEESRQDRYRALRAFGMLAIGVAYLVLLPLIGYVISLALLILAAAWYQEGARRRWLVPTAIVGAGVFWLVFVQILQIDQPAGFWPSLF